MTIDWSKAPEGATHFDPVDQNHPRQIGSTAQCWSAPTQSWVTKGWQYPDDLSTMPRLVARPAQWNGEGLPPVGTICEFNGFNPEETTETDPIVGDKVTVIAHFMSGPIELAVFTFYPPPDFEFLQVGQGAYGCFRPLRTPEQIAAEERQKEIDGMVYEMMRSRTGFGTDQTNAKEIAIGYAEQLHKSGYRKQVAP